MTEYGNRDYESLCLSNQNIKPANKILTFCKNKKNLGFDLF